jgi:acetyl esterase/lipase
MADKVFLDYDESALNRQYDQRAWVPNADELIRRYVTASDAVRARLGEPESLAYGAAPVETVDLYRAARAPAPVVVFLHGGARQRLSVFYGLPTTWPPLARTLFFAVAGKWLVRQRRRVAASRPTGTAA